MLFRSTDGLDRSPPEPNKCLNIADKADWFGWVDMLPPLFGEKKWRDHAAGKAPGRDTIFQCPAAKAPPKRIEYFSYAMNSCLELDKNCKSPATDPGCNNMPSFLNTASVKTPARVILLFDQLLEPAKGYNNTGNPDKSAGTHCGSYPKAFSSRHARQQGKLGGLILYCDYHIDWTASVWKPEWPDNLEVPPRSDKDWFPY